LPFCALGPKLIFPRRPLRGDEGELKLFEFEPAPPSAAADACGSGVGDRLLPPRCVGRLGHDARRLAVPAPTTAPCSVASPPPRVGDLRIPPPPPRVGDVGAVWEVGGGRRGWWW